MLQYLQRQLDAEEEIALAEVARIGALHPQSVSRFFQQHLGMNFQDYVQSMRIARACQLLRETREPVSHIALEVGFTSASHFNQLFRRIHQQTPTEYRRALSGIAG